MIPAEQQLDLVRSWFNRELTEAEIARAQEMVARGDRPPYVARCLMMWAAAEQSRRPQPGDEECKQFIASLVSPEEFDFSPEARVAAERKEK